MKIYLTGSTGFVGQNLLSFFQKNDLEFRTIDREALIDINSDFFVDCKTIIHLAGKAHDLKNAVNPDEYYKVNYELTKSLYSAFLLSNASQFIFVSSVKAGADVVTGILTEDLPSNPKTDYGKSKLMGEDYIRSQPVPEGKSYYILRPCMIHGPGNKGNLNLLFRFIMRGIPYPLAAFENKRSFLSVENLCFVIKKLIESDIPSDIYQVADDQSFSTNELVTILASHLNKQPKLWAIPSTLVKIMAMVGDFLNLPLNTERLNKLTENYVVSNDKIKKALHISLPLSAEEGLKVTAKSFVNPYHGG